MRTIWKALLASVFLCCITSINAQATFTNPIITGMNPDPSICRVGDDYYLITSTFEYFPGFPIYHSKDLVHWKQIGHVLSRASNNPLMGAESATGGQYAPTLRYNEFNGKFYVTGTNYGGQGSQGAFYVTASDITGPWSDPVWVGNWNVDPSPSFFNDTMYYLTPDNLGSFMLGAIDTATNQFNKPLVKIAEGLGGSSPEGPHLYKIDGKYYLMSAEGGTGFEHREVIQRSDSPWGPYEASPNNPVMSNKDVPDHPFQAIGHADLVELPDGSWWAVCLGVRPKGGNYNHLGRETFLAPVTWDEDGWPKVGTTGVVEEEYPVSNLTAHIWPAEPVRDEFDNTELALKWNFLRNPHAADWSLTERAGYLRLNGTGISFKEKDSPAFIGQRQTGFDVVASAKIDFIPTAENEEAGLVVRGDDKNHFDLFVTMHGGERVVMLKQYLKDEIKSVVYQSIPDGEVILRVSATALMYKFWVQEEGEKAILLDSAATKNLSTQVIGGFTGTYIGMYASGNGMANVNSADFDWFDFEENPTLPYSWAAGSEPTQNNMETPQFISLVSTNYDEVVLEWEDIDSEEYYIIERFDGVEYDSIGKADAGVTTFTDDELTGSTMYLYRLVAKNTSGYSMPSVAKSVVTKPAPGAYEGGPYQIPGQIEAEHYDYGDPGMAYYDVDAGNAFNTFREDDVDIETSWGEGWPFGYNIGLIANGEWVTYTVDVNTDKVDILFRVAAESVAGEVKIELDGELVAQTTLPVSGDWQTFETYELTGITIKPGINKVLKITFVKGGFNFNWIKFSEAALTPVDDEVKHSAMKIFPNPTTGMVTLSESQNWILIDVLGEELQSGQGTQVDLTNYPAGEYLLKLDQGVRRVIKK